MQGLTSNLYAWACQNIGTRQIQEDTYRFSSEQVRDTHGVLSVLSDGIGGMKDGARFSRIATETMIEHFESHPPHRSLCDCLIECYEAAQQAAIREQPEKASEQGGATLTAVLFRQDQCATLSIGDSRIYLLRQGGLIQLSRDQVLGPRLDERAALGFLTRDQAEKNTERKTLMANIGRESALPPDVCAHPFQLVPGDRIIQVSDGVFGTLSDERLEALLQEDVPDPAEHVIQTVMDEKKAQQDNCSIIILSYEGLNVRS